MAHTTLVRQAVDHDHQYAQDATKGKTCPIAAGSGAAHTSSFSQIATGGMCSVRNRLRSFGIPENTTNILMASWRPSTQKQYATYQNRWLEFCSRLSVDAFHPPVKTVLQFLTDLVHAGLSYSAINTARSALSALVDVNHRHTIGSHPLVRRFLKGVFEVRTPQPRYKRIWDVSLVLNYLRSLHPISDLTLKQLTQKLLMLIALTSAQRLQTLWLLDITNLHLGSKEAVFVLPNRLKQSHPGSKPLEVVITGYQEDEKLDVYSVLKRYLLVTKPLRGSETQLFISYIPPHKPVSRDSLSRWIREILAAAGVDVPQYAAHSTRAAAVSAASRKNLPIDDILNTAGWSSESIFARYYKKPIQVTGNNSFSMAILDA